MLCLWFFSQGYYNAFIGTFHYNRPKFSSSDSGLAAKGGRTSRELLLRAAQARCQPGSFISGQQGHDGALKGKAFFRLFFYSWCSPLAMGFYQPFHNAGDEEENRAQPSLSSRITATL
jgi:hypothetical protein